MKLIFNSKCFCALALTVIIFALSGCKPNNQPVIDSESREGVSKLSAEISTLEEKIKAVTDETTALKKDLDLNKQSTKNYEDIVTRLNRVENKVSLLEFSKNQYASITLDPGRPTAYQRLDSDTGSFLVSLDSVSPYLDGQKVTLSIGNPSSATYSGFTLKVRWGLRYPKYDANKAGEFFEQYELAKKSTQETEIKLTNKLSSGKWNKVSFNLTPAPANAFGRIELEIITNTVELGR